MGSCETSETLVRQLHSVSPSVQDQAVAALSALPLTSRNWLSAAAAVPRLVEMLHSTSTAEPRASAIDNLLGQISSSIQDGRRLDAAPDATIQVVAPQGMEK